MNTPWFSIAVIAASLLAPLGGARAAYTETVLHDFTGSPDGAGPFASMVFDAAGNLYGTTTSGGAANRGAVFKLTPPAAGLTAWTETLIYSFSGPDGAAPYAGMIFDSAGNLYGATSGSGASNAGTVFKLAPPAAGLTAWTHTVLYRFTGGSDGGSPISGALAMDAAGNLYGTTIDGGARQKGVVFKLAPPAAGLTAWTETVLHSFLGGSDGAGPNTGVILGPAGNLYGATGSGGTPNYGAVFKLKPPAPGKTNWTETVLYSFTGGVDGSTPQAALVLDRKGDLYGTTISGGGSGDGTVFKLTHPAAGATVWIHSVIHSFTGPDGASPYAPVVFDARGDLYGTTVSGGVSSKGVAVGTVFKLKHPAVGATAWTASILHSFTGLKGDGAYPFAGVIFDGAGDIYGVTSGGGVRPKKGVAFELTP